MMRSKCSLIFLFLLSFFMTAMAQDEVRLRNCRRGTPRPAEGLHHAAHLSRTPGGNFYKGDRHQLVVLVDFADRSFKDDETTTMDLWNKVFNAENYTEAPYKGSIHDYFYAQSYALFNLMFDLQYVQLSENCEKYRSWDRSYGDAANDDENSQYLVQDIMEVLKTRDIDWSLYDWNGDGYVNQLIIVYAGKGMNDGGGKDSIWPHQWWLSEHLKDRQSGVYCDPIKVNYSDKDYLVDCYCTAEEIGGTSASFGTICHEYSHCFGFPDFYYGSIKYVGYWDLMDYGNYNGGGYCPAGYSAHERWLMDWLTPTELTTAATMTGIPALCDEAQAYLVRNDGFENEYYFVENRQQKGWDEELPGSGMVVFHIDYDPAVWVSTTEMTNTPFNQRYTIIPANNKTSSSFQRGWTYPYNGNNLLTNESTPAATLKHENTDGTNFMNKPLTNMSVTDGIASFDFMGGATGIFEKKVYGQPKILYDFGPIYIIRNVQGETKKVIKH